MPGRRRKGKKKRKKSRNVVVQCVQTVISGCFGKRKSENKILSPISVKEELDQYSVQTLEIAERHEPRLLHKIESKTTCRSSRKTSPLSVKRRALNNNLPILENLEVANIMRIIFHESKHASWLIPYMCEKDDTYINKDAKTTHPTMVNAPGQATDAENEFNEVCASFTQSIINTAVIELEEEDKGKAQIEYEEKLAKVCTIFTESIICDAIDEVEEEDNEAVKKKHEKDVDELCTLFAQLTISEAVDELKEHNYDEQWSAFTHSIIDTAIDEVEQQDREAANREVEEEIDKQWSVFTQSIIDAAIDEVEEEDREAANKEVEEENDKQWSAFTLSIIDTAIDEVEQEDREATNREVEEEIDKQWSAFTQSIIDAAIDEVEQEDREAAKSEVEEEIDKQWSVFTQSIIEAAIDEVEEEDRESANREVEEEIDKQWPVFTQPIIDAAIDEVEEEDREATNREVEEEIDKQWSAFTLSIIDTAIDEAEQEDLEAANREVEEEIDKQCSTFTQSIIDVAIDEVEQEDREAANREVEDEMDKQWSAFTQSIIDAAIDEVEQEDREAANREADEEMDKQTLAFTQSIIDAAVDQVEQEDCEAGNRKVEEEMDKQTSAFTQSIIDAAIDEGEQEDRKAAEGKVEEEMDKQWSAFTQSIIDAAIGEVDKEDHTVANRKVEEEMDTDRSAFSKAINNAAIDEVEQEDSEATKSEVGKEMDKQWSAFTQSIIDAAINEVEQEDREADNRKKHKRQNTKKIQAKIENIQASEGARSKTIVGDESKVKREAGRNKKKRCAKQRRSKYWKEERDMNQEWKELKMKIKNNKNDSSRDIISASGSKSDENKKAETAVAGYETGPHVAGSKNKLDPAEMFTESAGIATDGTNLQKMETIEEVDKEREAQSESTDETPKAVAGLEESQSVEVSEVPIKHERNDEVPASYDPKDNFVGYILTSRLNVVEENEAQFLLEPKKQISINGDDQGHGGRQNNPNDDRNLEETRQTEIKTVSAEVAETEKEVDFESAAMSITFNASDKALAQVKKAEKKTDEAVSASITESTAEQKRSGPTEDEIRTSVGIDEIKQLTVVSQSMDKYVEQQDEVKDDGLAKFVHVTISNEFSHFKFERKLNETVWHLTEKVIEDAIKETSAEEVSEFITDSQSNILARNSKDIWTGGEQSNLTDPQNELRRPDYPKTTSPRGKKVRKSRHWIENGLQKQWEELRVHIQNKKMTTVIENKHLTEKEVTDITNGHDTAEKRDQPKSSEVNFEVNDTCATQLAEPATDQSNKKSFEPDTDPSNTESFEPGTNPSNTESLDKNELKESFSKKILAEVNAIRNAIADLKEAHIDQKATVEETFLVERIVFLSTSIEEKADVLIQNKKDILSSVARSRSSQLIHSGNTEDSSLTSQCSKSNKGHFNIPLKGNEALHRARPYLRDIVKSKLAQKRTKDTYIAESTSYAIATTAKQGILTFKDERIKYMQSENKVVLGVRTLEHYGDDLSKHEIKIDDLTGDMNVSASNTEFKDLAWNPEEHRKDIDDVIEQWKQSQSKGNHSKDGKSRDISGRTPKKDAIKLDVLGVNRIEEFIGDYFKNRIEVKRNAAGNREVDDIEFPIAKDILGFFFPPCIDLETRERIRKHQVKKDFKYEMTWEWNETDTYRRNEDTGEIVYDSDNDIPYTGRLKNYMKKTKECVFYSDISCQVMDQTAEEKSSAGKRLRSGLIKCAQLEDEVATVKEEEKKRKERAFLEEKTRREREEEEARIKNEEQEQEQGMLQEKEVADSENTKTKLKKYAVQFTCLMGGFYLFELEIEDLVAEGKFGKTYEGYYNDDPVEVVVFAEGYPTVVTSRLLSLKSHFVSSVLVHLQNEKELDCLIYPDCYLGTLWDLMQADPNRRRLGEAHAVFVLTGLMEGIRYISSKYIIHAHLTPDLVKFNNKGYPVICDFSRAYNFKDGGYVKPRSEKFNVDYSAPEIGRWKKIVPESDIFSAGCMAYEIVEGLPPFTGDDDLQTVKNVFDKKFKVDYDPKIFSKKAQDSISVCLRSDADDRTEWEDWYLFMLERDIDIEQKSRSPMLLLVQKLLP